MRSSSGDRICATDQTANQYRELLLEDAGASGLRYVTTDGLDGPISACSATLPPDPPDVTIKVRPVTIAGVTVFSGAAYSFPLPSTAAFLDAYGTCSDGLPDDLSGASREPWPASEPPSRARGTIVFIHGRGASCADKDALLGDGGGKLAATNQRLYCLEYDGADKEPDRRCGGVQRSDCVAIRKPCGTGPRDPRDCRAGRRRLAVRDLHSACRS